MRVQTVPARAMPSSRRDRIHTARLANTGLCKFFDFRRANQKKSTAQYSARTDTQTDTHMCSRIFMHTHTYEHEHTCAHTCTHAHTHRHVILYSFPHSISRYYNYGSCALLYWRSARVSASKHVHFLVFEVVVCDSFPHSPEQSC